MTCLAAFLKIRQAAELASPGDHSWSGRKFQATLTYTLDITEAVTLLDTEGRISESRCENNPANVADFAIGQKIYLEVDAPRSFAENLADLIERFPINPPDDYVVFEQPANTAAYDEVVKIGRLLNEVAVDEDQQNCLLISDREVRIHFKYNESDLKHVRIPDNFSICSFSDQETGDDPTKTHTDRVMRNLVKHAICDHCVNISEDERFKQLITTFPDCIQRFDLSFRAFAEEASGALKKFDTRRVEIITALNGVLGNIQTSLIGIPLAVIFALQKLKIDEGNSIGNLAICVGGFVVFLLLLFLSISQGRTVCAIVHLQNDLSSELGANPDDGTKSGKLLNETIQHRKWIQRLLCATRVVIILLLVGVAAIAGYLFSVESSPSDGAKDPKKLQPTSGDATLNTQSVENGETSPIVPDISPVLPSIDLRTKSPERGSAQ